MMNPKFLRTLTAIFAAATFLAGLGAYINILPGSYAKVAGCILAGVLAVKEVVVIIGDIADDGKRNNSFNPTKGGSLSLLLCLLLPVVLASCKSPFMGLNQDQWGEVGGAFVKGALKGGAAEALPEWNRQRSAARQTLSSAKAPVSDLMPTPSE